VAWVTSLGLALNACAATFPKLSPLGRSIEVQPARNDPAPAVKGELIAVDPERVWVLEPGRLSHLALDEVEQVSVRRHGLNRKAALRWTLLGALISGTALSLACGTVEDAEGCSAILLGVGATWGLFGALSAPSLEKSSQLRVPASDWEALRPYARFPQGLPEGLDLDSLVGRAPASDPAKP
jgi:hypothetical protein